MSRVGSPELATPVPQHIENNIISSFVPRNDTWPGCSGIWMDTGMQVWRCFNVNMITKECCRVVMQNKRVGKKAGIFELSDLGAG